MTREVSANVNAKGVYDVDNVRKDFPMLSTEVNGKPLVYLDNAATTHKPKSVIDRVSEFDSRQYATIHRGAYRLSERATAMYDEVRAKVAGFIGADDPREIIFTSGTTQSINLVASSFSRAFVNEGDEILITTMEHHANIVPWQVAAAERGAKLVAAPVNDRGELLMDEFEKLLSERTKIVAVTQVSNALGTINPVKEITAMAHGAGAKVLVDGAQSAPHMKVDVKDIGCDFFALSGHKMFAPTGIGALYGRMELLEAMPPYVTGGDMIVKVSFEKTTYAKPPAKFEAGTQPISQVIGLGAAIDYISNIGLDRIHEYENELLEYGSGILKDVPGLKIIGEAERKASILSFAFDAVHPHDVATLLDQDGIAVRGGHHCAQPTMKRFSVPATTRASLAFYNKREELDALAASLKKIVEMFS